MRDAKRPSGLLPASQPSLTTARLSLTPFTLADAPAVYAYASDPEVARYVTWPPHEQLHDAEVYLATLATQLDTFCWAIRLTPKGWAIGAIELSLDTPNLASVHYVLARPSWGQGFATEALRAVIVWGLGALPEVTEVRTWVAEANVPSRRVLEKCGFRLMGRAAHIWEKLPEPISMCLYARGREVSPDTF